MPPVVEEDSRSAAPSVASYSTYNQQKSTRAYLSSYLFSERHGPSRDLNAPNAPTLGSRHFDDSESLASRRSPTPSFFDPNYDTEVTWIGTSSSSLHPLPASLHTHPSPEDDSPYPEVRSAVANFDDPSMPVNTLRAWFLGILWAVIIPGINEFYYFRYPSLVVSSVRPSSCSRTGSSTSPPYRSSPSS